MDDFNQRRDPDREEKVKPDHVSVRISSCCDHKVVEDNFIAKNFHEVEDCVSTDKTSIGDQLKQDSDSCNFTKAKTYGYFESAWIDENCYIRSKYLKFALHKEVPKSLNKLLSEEWKIGEPKFLINVFKSTADSNKDYSEECKTKLKQIVQMSRKTNSWIMAHSQTEPLIGDYNREESQKSATFQRNIIYWKTWSDIDSLKNSKDREQLEQSGNMGYKKIVTAEPKFTWDSNQRILMQQSSFFLLPQYTSTANSPANAARDHLMLVKELAKTFDEDGHRENCRNVSLHVCSPLNFFVPAPGPINDEDKKVLEEMLKSGIPTILLCDKSTDVQSIVSALGIGGATDLSDNNAWIGLYKKVKTGEPEESIKFPFNDLSIGIKTILIDSRKNDVEDKQTLRNFRNECYTDLYLSMVLGLHDECQRILKENTSNGIRESLVSMLYMYMNPNLLEFCIQNNYNVKTCLYNTGNSNMTKMLLKMFLKRGDNCITNKFLDKPDSNDEAERATLNFINGMIGKDSYFESVLSKCNCIDPMNDPNKIFKSDRMYILFCLIEEWKMAEIYRKYSDFTIFKCFLAIKIMLKIKEIRSNTVSSDYYDVQSLDNEIEKLDKQAGEMVERSFKEGLDIGPVVLWEHPRYNDLTILDLAEQTLCLKILEDKTHVHSYITSQWNGALDPTTGWYKIVLSWFTLGLLAPLIIKYVPKKSKTDETSLFFNGKGKDRSFLNKVKSLWTSPRSKLYLLMVTYIVFLVFQTIVILDTTRIKSASQAHNGDNLETWDDDEKQLQFNILLCLVFVVCFLSVEIDIKRVTRYNFKSKICHYISQGYNKVDLFAAFTFIIYVILTFLMQGDENVFLAAKIILSMSYIGYIIRFTQFLQMFEQIGPKLISIKNMLADLAFFAAFLLLSIFAYGIVSEFLLHPYPRTVRTSEIANILKRPYVNMFGELDLDTLEAGIEEGVCKYEYYLNSIPVEDAQCDEYKCQEICERFKLLGRVLLGLYTMVTVILLTNLLVSIFGKTYDTDHEKTRQLWQLQRYKLVKEADSQFILPFPPFNLLHSVYTWIVSCPFRCNVAEKDSAYEKYIKEVEYKCSRQLENKD
ncbi:hypothetical protein ACHWQZ_G014443 [Mnemiopsis leidyi]